MTKSLGVAILVVSTLLSVGGAAAQYPDEVARLKKESDLLKRENDLLKRENDLLKSEVAKLKLAAQHAKKDHQENRDANRIAGEWRLVRGAGNGVKDAKAIEVTLYKNGGGKFGWKWIADEGGKYTVTGPNATFTLELDATGKKLSGQDAGGRGVEGTRR
jgi:hypothetical protein